jgi:hypothetical protein
MKYIFLLVYCIIIVAEAYYFYKTFKEAKKYLEFLILLAAFNVVFNKRNIYHIAILILMFLIICPFTFLERMYRKTKKLLKNPIPIEEPELPDEEPVVVFSEVENSEQDNIEEIAIAEAEIYAPIVLDEIIKEDIKKEPRKLKII